MPRKVHREDPPHIAIARKRMDAACIVIANVLDGGDRDPTWAESQELENAGIALGRALQAPDTSCSADPFEVFKP